MSLTLEIACDCSRHCCRSACRPALRTAAGTLLTLLVIEIWLGLLLVAASLPLGVALAHNLGAALLLAAVFALA